MRFFDVRVRRAHSGYLAFYSDIYLELTYSVTYGHVESKVSGQLSILAND